MMPDPWSCQVQYGRTSPSRPGHIKLNLHGSGRRYHQRWPRQLRAGRSGLPFTYWLPCATRAFALLHWHSVRVPPRARARRRCLATYGAPSTRPLLSHGRGDMERTLHGRSSSRSRAAACPVIWIHQLERLRWMGSGSSQVTKACSHAWMHVVYVYVGKQVRRSDSGGCAWWMAGTQSNTIAARRPDWRAATAAMWFSATE